MGDAEKEYGNRVMGSEDRALATNPDKFCEEKSDTETSVADEENTEVAKSGCRYLGKYYDLELPNDVLNSKHFVIKLPDGVFVRAFEWTLSIPQAPNYVKKIDESEIPEGWIVVAATEREKSPNV